MTTPTTTPHAAGQVAHTPTPYFTQAAVEATNILAGSGRADSTALVCTVNHGWGTGPETADFIVRACNSHAALVEALEYAQAFMDSANLCSPEVVAVVPEVPHIAKAICAALAIAKGQP